MSEITNVEKYGNYREQMSRLKKAMDAHFLLEALFIEYAIMEDRCKSLLEHSGNAVYPKASISKKVERIEKLLNQGNPTLSKYISHDLLQEILRWKDERNRLVHALMKQSLTSEELNSLRRRGRQSSRHCVQRQPFTRGRWKENKNEWGNKRNEEDVCCADGVRAVADSDSRNG